MQNSGHNGKRIFSLMLVSVLAWGIYAPSFAADDTELPDFGRAGSTQVDKEETVYAILSAEGDINEIVVDEYLRNGNASDVINDYSILQNIENTSGDEAYERDGDSIKWDAGGNGIRYEGTAFKELPVKLDISYYLNGMIASPDEIAGKAGNVEIHFDYSVIKTERINGYDLKHPYLMISGLMLDKDHFSNITVSTGKVVDNGSNSICIGMALPGMKENLALKEDTLEIPESVVVKARTDCFEMEGTYTLALSEIPPELGIGETAEKAGNKADELIGGLSKLSSAGEELLQGSEKFEAGAKKLSEGTGDAVSGTKKIKEGSSELKKGTSDMKKGATNLKEGTSQLVDGAEKEMEGTSELKEGTSQLVDGARELKAGTKEADEIAEMTTGEAKQFLRDARYLIVSTGIDQLLDDILIFGIVSSDL